MSQKQALVVFGGWDGHEPDRCAAIIGRMLEAEGCAVTAREGPAGFDDPELGRFDLIVPICTMSKIDKPVVEALCATVRAGTGLGGFHGGMCDAFREQTEYQFMCGGQWVAHPGNIIDYRVTITAPDDPITAGIGDFDYHSEQYYMHVDPGIEVLATTTFSGEHAPWTRGVVMPQVWKHRYGAARVFFSALGHVSAEFAVPQMHEIVRRGLTWAMR